MDLEVTELFVDSDFEPSCASGSVTEWGDTAGQITYAYAKSFLDSNSALFKTIVAERRTVECYFREFGAWAIEEIREWSDRDLVGTLVQDIAGNYREIERYCDNNYADYDIEYVLSMEQGMKDMPTNLYVCDGKWYFYMGFYNR